MNTQVTVSSGIRLPRFSGGLIELKHGKTSPRPPTEAKPVSALTCSGSSGVIPDILQYSICSILHQRGLYGSSAFKQIRRWGLIFIVPAQPTLSQYMSTLLDQVTKWLASNVISQLNITIVDPEGTAIEKWQFAITASPAEVPSESQPTEIADDSKVALQTMMREITSSSSVLPLLPRECVPRFTVVEHGGAELSCLWSEGREAMLENASALQFHSAHHANFSVAPSVLYTTSKP